MNGHTRRRISSLVINGNPKLSFIIKEEGFQKVMQPALSAANYEIFAIFS